MFDDMVKAGIKKYIRGLWVGMPGSLESYDHATRKGTVKPLIQEPNQAGTLLPLKPIVNVPVHMPGGQRAGLHLPPAVGDTGWISFSHRSMEIWLDRGGDAPPGDPRIMDMTDAVFWPGLYPFSEANGHEEGAVVLRNQDAALQIKDGKVALGNDKLPILPCVPPMAGQLELLNILDYLLTQLANPSLVTGSAVINPAFTLSVQGLQANLQSLKGSL